LAEGDERAGVSLGLSNTVLGCCRMLGNEMGLAGKGSKEFVNKLFACLKDVLLFFSQGMKEANFPTD
jgi:hypothetical protein